jgi:hypothetical protein
MQDVVEEYPEGGTVTAYVSPSNPSNSVLIRTSSSLMYLALAGFGVLLVGLGGRRLLAE